MEMLKKNVFWIVCGAVAVLGIALSVLGLNAMGAVTTEMNQAEDLQRRIQGAAGRPVNKAIIDAEHARVDAIRQQFKDVTAEARKRNAKPPLGVSKDAWEKYLTEISAPPAPANPGEEPKPPAIADCVFPEAKAPLALAYQDAYEKELDRLKSLLRAGGPPTPAEITHMTNVIREEQLPSKTAPPAPPGQQPPPGETPGTEAKPATSALITQEECRNNAPCRAAVVKAHTLYCYLGDDALQVGPKVLTGTLTDLKPELLWEAQRTLWVEQDVVESLAAINNRAADEIKRAGKEPWVGVLPVKDVISIRVSDYIHEKSDASALAKPGGETPAKPPGTVAESFTGLVSTPAHYTLQFTLKAVVDARQVPLIVNEICKDRFHTPIRIAYAAESPNLRMAGKVYGEDPVVNLVVDFESYYFTDVYRPLMPKSVLADASKTGEKP